jgi:hypothetical protein
MKKNIEKKIANDRKVIPRNQKASQRPLDYEMKRIENVKDLKDK